MTKSNINFFLKIIGPFKIIVLTILVIITTFFDLLSIGLILPALNFFIEPGQENILLKIISENKILNSVSHANIIIIILLFSFIIKIFLNIVSSYYLTVIGKKIKVSVSRKIFLKFLSFEYKNIIKNKIPNIIRILTYDVENFVHSINNYIVLLVEIFLLLSIIILLLSINFFSTIIIFFIFIFVLSFFYIFTSDIRKKNAIIKQLFTSKLIKNFNEGFGAIKEIIILQKQNFFYELFFKNLSIKENAFQKIAFITILPRFIIEMTAILMVCFFLFFISQNDKDFVSYISIIGVYLVAMLRMIPSINKLVYAIQTVQLTKPSVDSIKKEWKKNDKKEKFNQNTKNLSFKQKIEFKNIFFKYNKSEKILNNFNFTINKGDKILISGKSGSGKSTFLDLFSGLQKPNRGKILVDGVNINEKNNLSKWLKTISYVPQNTFIFDENLILNLIMDYKNDFNFDQIKKVIHDVNLKELFIKNKKIFFRNLGERGSNLSGGQRQRVGLSRHLLRNKEVLILDESLNSLDKNNQKLILKKLITNKFLTLILVSHDLEMKKLFKKSFIFKTGKIKLN